MTKFHHGGTFIHHLGQRYKTSTLVEVPLFAGFHLGGTFITDFAAKVPPWWNLYHRFCCQSSTLVERLSPNSLPKFHRGGSLITDCVAKVPPWWKLYHICCCQSSTLMEIQPTRLPIHLTTRNTTRITTRIPRQRTVLIAITMQTPLTTRTPISMTRRTPTRMTQQQVVCQLDDELRALCKFNIRAAVDAVIPEAEATLQSCDSALLRCA